MDPDVFRPFSVGRVVAINRPVQRDPLESRGEMEIRKCVHETHGSVSRLSEVLDRERRAWYLDTLSVQSRPSTVVGPLDGYYGPPFPSLDCHVGNLD